MMKMLVLSQKPAAFQSILHSGTVMDFFLLKVCRYFPVLKKLLFLLIEGMVE